jgi:hypothetical protein
MDLDKLSNGEKIAGVSAILLFIFMFFEWFSAEVSVGGRSASEGASAWDALDFIPVILVIVVLVALAVVALRLMDSPYEPPISANAVVAVLGALAFILILYRIIDTPGTSASVPGFSVDVSPAWGIFISLIASAGITYGGYKAMQEEGVTFSDVGDRLSSGGTGTGTGGTGTGGTGHSAQPPAGQTPPPPPPAAPQQPPAPPASSEQPPPPPQSPPPAS